MSSRDVPPGRSQVPAIDRILVTSRDYYEYLAMFGLDTERLRTERILDCPGGASDFGLRIREHGGRAVSVDPIYEQDPVTLAGLIAAELDRGVRGLDIAMDLYDFSWTGGRDSYISRRERTAQRFLADYGLHWHERRAGHYVAARLPELPFKDYAFTLAVVPNLLFSYANLFDLAWHVEAVHELTRVAREVRIHPLTDTRGQEYGELDALTARLVRTGIATRRIAANYRLHKGRQWTLICRRDGARERR